MIIVFGRLNLLSIIRPWVSLEKAGNPPVQQEEIEMKRTLFVAAAVALSVSSVPALAQDPAKVDAKHYTVEFENDQVRVLRIKYGAKEKSVMHQHPGAVAIFLTDGKAKFTLPDGKTIDDPFKAGTTKWTPSGKHLPENVGDKPFELVLVEVKEKPAAGKPAADKPAADKPAAKK